MIGRVPEHERRIVDACCVCRGLKRRRTENPNSVGLNHKWNGQQQRPIQIYPGLISEAHHFNKHQTVRVRTTAHRHLDLVWVCRNQTTPGTCPHFHGGIRFHWNQAKTCGGLRRRWSAQGLLRIAKINSSSCSPNIQLCEQAGSTNL